MIDVERFEAGMETLAKHFKRTLDPDQIHNYAMVLDPFLRSDQFDLAIRWTCDTCVRMPSPGDLLDYALDLPDAAGEVA